VTRTSRSNSTEQISYVGFLLSILTIALFCCPSACSTFGFKEVFNYRQPPGNVLTYSYVRGDAKANGLTFFKDAYQQVEADRDKQKAVRNRILYELMGVVDDYYYRWAVNSGATSPGKD
jgi:hypothetical protein